MEFLLRRDKSTYLPEILLVYNSNGYLLLPEVRFTDQSHTLKNIVSPFSLTFIHYDL